MWPDRVSSPGPLTYESGALPIALRGPARKEQGGLRNIGLRRCFSLKSFILTASKTITKNITTSALNAKDRQMDCAGLSWTPILTVMGKMFKTE